MQVWVVHEVGPGVAQLVGMFTGYEDAYDVVSMVDTSTGNGRSAVLFELNKDYTNIHKFTLFTNERPEPFEVDFTAQNRPIDLPKV